jgi:hypothetical protein
MPVAIRRRGQLDPQQRPLELTSRDGSLRHSSGNTLVSDCTESPATSAATARGLHRLLLGEWGRGAAMKTTLGAAAILLSAAPAWAQTGFTDVRIREIEPSVVVQRSGEGESYQAEVNEPLTSGDRIWTSASGRAELVVADETLVWVGTQSEIEIAGQSRQEGSGLRLWSGALVAQTRPSAAVTIEAPQGGVELGVDTRALVELRAGALRLFALQGEVRLRTASASIAIAEGESTTVSRSGAIARPSAFDLGALEADDLVAWSLARGEPPEGTVAGQEYLPDVLQPYGGELSSYGDWRYEVEAGYVWYPRVDISWRPYCNGRWTHTRFGWTWVPRERWGWLPSHYGRWGHSSRHGWYWIPGRRWSPAWVAWSNRGGRVGWSPLDRHDRPASYRGHAVRRGTARAYGDGSEHQAWSYSDSASFGARRSFRDGGARDDRRSTDAIRRFPRTTANREQMDRATPRRDDRSQWSWQPRNDTSTPTLRQRRSPEGFSVRREPDRRSQGSWRSGGSSFSAPRRDREPGRSFGRGERGSAFGRRSPSSGRSDGRSSSGGNRGSSSGGDHAHRRAR